MTQTEMRTALIDSTIQVVAEGGLDKATTKGIAASANLNEAYIYRLFDSKEDLLKKAFLQCNERMGDVFIQGFREGEAQYSELESIHRRVLQTFWNFLLDNREECLFFVRYYYSPYFQKNARQEYLDTYARMVRKTAHCFPEGADVAAFMHHALDIILTYAVKAIHGEVANDERTVERIFQLIYGLIAIYNNEEKQEVLQECRSPMQ